MSEFEIFGTRSYANSYEKSFQQRYDYYAINNVASARIRGADSAVSNAVAGSIAAGAAVHWWERSPSLADWYELHNPGFGWVHTNGSAKYQDYINIPDKRQGNGFVPNFVMVAD